MTLTTIKKTLLPVLALALLALGGTACENDDTDMSAIIAEYELEPRTVAIDSSDLAEQPDVPPTDENDSTFNDYEENTNWDRIVTITYDGDTAYASTNTPGIALRVRGAHVTVISIYKRVQMILSGASENGSLKVYSEYRFKLALNGVTLTNPTGPAINNQCGKTLCVVSAEGTVNTLRDGTTYADSYDEDQKAAFFSEGQIVFSGSGRLNVLAVGKGGINSDDYVRFRPGCRIYVNSTAGNGIRGKDSVLVDGGVVNVEVSADGAKAVTCRGNISMKGGRLTAIATGGTLVAGADTTSAAALKCDSLLTLSGGTLRLLAKGEDGKAVNCGLLFTMTGGSLTAVATGAKVLGSPKGVKCDGQVVVSGGSFYAYAAHEVPVDADAGLTFATGYTSRYNGPRAVIVEY